MRVKRRLFSVAFSTVMLLGCQGQDAEINRESSEVKTLSTAPMPGRWYSEAQLASGKTLYLNNCARCHKADASGTDEWKTPDQNDKYPPPPLNGSAHTWHHSMDVLRRTIKRGGVALGGVMPGFSDILKSNEIDEVIAYFQSTWPEEKYSVWLKRTK